MENITTKMVELLLKNTRKGATCFQRILLTDGELSIQGSKMNHHCSPRKDLENILDYETLEVGVESSNSEFIEKLGFKYDEIQGDGFSIVHNMPLADVIQAIIRVES